MEVLKKNTLTVNPRWRLAKTVTACLAWFRHRHRRARRDSGADLFLLFWCD
jgi:hypothetical protein